MGIVSRLFRRQQPKNENKLIIFDGKIDLERFPDREARTSIAMEIDANFRSLWGHLFTEGNKPDILLSDEGGISAVYMITTSDLHVAEEATQMLFNLWDPYTVE